jgi:hypothetical protein
VVRGSSPLAGSLTSAYSHRGMHMRASTHPLLIPLGSRPRHLSSDVGTWRRLSVLLMDGSHRVVEVLRRLRISSPTSEVVIHRRRDARVAELVRDLPRCLPGVLEDGRRGLLELVRRDLREFVCHGAHTGQFGHLQ